jgi:hypothetical protein
MDEQNIIIDTKSVSEAGFDGNLIRPIETEPSGEFRYIDPNSLVGGTLGKMGVLYIGGKNIRLDARRQNMVFNDGTEDVVTLGKLKDGSFGLDVADGKIQGAWIVANSITANQIEAGTITATEIAANTITANEIAANAITSDELAATSVIAGKIAAGAINAANLIVDGTITADKLSVTSLSAISANLGTITAGSLDAVTITSATITLDESTDGGSSTTGYLLWGDSGRIWTTTAGYLGFQADGNRLYFYSSANLLCLMDYATGGGTGSMNSYLPFVVGAGVTAQLASLYVGDSTHQQDLFLNGYLAFLKNGPATPGNNTLYRNGDALNYKDQDGTTFSIDMTAI